MIDVFTSALESSDGAGARVAPCLDRFRGRQCCQLPQQIRDRGLAALLLCAAPATMPV
jgi:hypothetical protein